MDLKASLKKQIINQFLSNGETIKHQVINVQVIRMRREACGKKRSWHISGNDPQISWTDYGKEYTVSA
jgi:hypothetical protein